MQEKLCFKRGLKNFGDIRLMDAVFIFIQ